MKKFKTLIFSVSVLVLGLFWPWSNSPGQQMNFEESLGSPFSFLDGRLKFQGFIENLTAIHAEDSRYGENAGDLTLFRNTFQLECEGKIFERGDTALGVYGVFRTHWDGRWSLDRDLNERPRHAADNVLERDADIREAYLTYSKGPLAVRAGKQQVVWGESDGLRMADVINPLDLRWNYIFESWEDIREPRWLVDLTYSLIPARSGYLELLWIPNAFDKGVTPMQYPHEGSTWGVYDENAFQRAFAPLPPGAIAGLLGQQQQGPGGKYFNIPQWFITSLHKDDDHSISDSEGGFKLRGIFGGWDMSTYYLYMFNQVPVVDTVRWFAHDPAAVARLLIGQDPGPSDSLLEFEREHVLGFTFSKYNEFTKAVLRGEFNYIIDREFNSVAKSPRSHPPFIPFAFIRGLTPESSDVFKYMLGFDRPTWIKCLNPTSTFFISGQFFQSIILDHTDRMVFTGQGQDKVMNVLTFLINSSYRHDTLRPQLFVIYDLSGNGLVWPELTYVKRGRWIGDNEIKVSLGTQLMWGNKSGQYNNENFAFTRESNQIYLRIRMNFI